MMESGSHGEFDNPRDSPIAPSASGLKHPSISAAFDEVEREIRQILGDHWQAFLPLSDGDQAEDQVDLHDVPPDVPVIGPKGDTQSGRAPNKRCPKAQESILTQLQLSQPQTSGSPHDGESA